MSAINYSDGDFIINGTSSKLIANSLLQAGLRESVIADVIGGWFVGVTGSADPAPFRFVTNVEATDPNCSVDYQRTFLHTDWVDGENRVQAGMTPEELGFNARFHGVENEFDTIADQFKRLGACTAEIRTELAGVVQELEAKITTLQNQVHALQQTGKVETGPTIIGVSKFNGKESFVTKFGNDFKFVQFENEPITKVIPKLPRIDFRPEILDTGKLNSLVLELDKAFSSPQIDALFATGRPVTVRDLRRTASDLTLESGATLGAVIADLPSDAEFSVPAEAIGKILTSVATNLPPERATEVRSETLSAEAEARTGGALLNSSVSAVVPDAAIAAALKESGFGTIGLLSSARISDVVATLEARGMVTNRDDVSNAVARAVIGRAIRGFGG